mmetsp:Transcript_64344/g.147416  ORF Transcript_64344/g.147416 Transcript_64344/m.147416 type:complete len:469 (-) Transcript_64344:130-1536(-)
MEARVAALRQVYAAASQSHVFKFFETLSEVQQEELVKQLEGIDVKRVIDTYKQTVASSSSLAAPTRVDPLPVVLKYKSADAAKRAEWSTAGLQLVARGKVAFLLLAGGQGTRLGTADPKGCYDIGLPSHKSLFQLMAERLTRLQGMSGAAAGIPWYVMTSPMTDAATQAFFEKHAFFGLAQKDVYFFEQGTLPCLSLAGDILLETAGWVATAPDGNGGIYRALLESGALADMKTRGVEMVHASSVDNALVLPADPAFIGYCCAEGADCGAKVCAKASAEEAVGVLCAAAEGGARVVEYSEIDPAASREIDATTGALRLNAGNICNHFYTTAFLEMAAALPTPFHIAKKKIPTVDDTGSPVVPEQTNGVKLEMFIFDCFPFSKKFSCVEVERQEEFGPVKNAPGAATDSPDTARALLLALGRRYLLDAGASLQGEGGVEVSPLVSYCGEGLETMAAKGPVSAGAHISAL